MERNDNTKPESCEANGDKEVHQTAAESLPKCEFASRIDVDEVGVQKESQSIGRDDYQDGNHQVTMSSTKVVSIPSSPCFCKGRVGKKNKDKDKDKETDKDKEKEKDNDVARRSVVGRITKDITVETSSVNRKCPSSSSSPMPRSNTSDKKSKAGMKDKARVEETNNNEPNELQWPMSFGAMNHSTNDPSLIPPEMTQGPQARVIMPFESSSVPVDMSDIPNHDSVSTENEDFQDETTNSRNGAAVFEAYTVQDAVIVPAENVVSETDREMSNDNDAVVKSDTTRRRTKKWKDRCMFFLDSRVLVVVALVIVVTTLTTMKQLGDDDDKNTLNRISPNSVAPKAGDSAKEMSPNPTIPPSFLTRPAEDTLTENSSVQSLTITPSTGPTTTRDALKPCEEFTDCWTKIGSDLIGPVHDDQFGEEVALGTIANKTSKDIIRISVSAIEDYTNGNSSGAIYTYDWNEETKTFDSVGTPLHGSSNEKNLKGRLSKDGRRLVVGSPFYGGLDANERNIGQVTVYELVDGEWKILGDPIRGKVEKERFGTSFDISFDGSVFVASATFHNEATGCLRVYRFDGEKWYQKGDDIQGPSVGEQFGWAVTISGDGNVVSAGPRGQNADMNFGDMGFNSGYIRVYRYEKEEWVLVGNTIPGDAAGDNFGRSISLSYDGNIVAAGAWVVDRNDTNPSSSRVRAFSYDEDGGEWILMGGSGLSPFGVSDWPHRVSLSSDGMRLAVSSGEFGDEGIGSVVVYEFADGKWGSFGGVIVGEQRKIAPFISLSADGSRILLGLPLSRGSPHPVKGIVRLFEI